MSQAPQIRIPAMYLRGGTSKGVFFRLDDLPEPCRVPGPARDALLLRVIGSPDPYGKQIDGLGGATSSTSKVVILSQSQRPDHDVDYLFGQVAIDRPLIDWSGNCGNLSAAVGPFAIHSGLIGPERLPEEGICRVRIWQANIGKTIIAEVPIRGGRVQETGDFMLDGVAFPAAEIRLEFLDPAEGGALFPTGNPIDRLEVPGVGTIEATLIDAGIPTVFIAAASIGQRGTETQDAVNGDPRLLELLESIRAQGALRMGLIRDPAEAAARQHTPKIAYVAPPADSIAADGRHISAQEIDLCVRALSMGRLHHAMMGTAAVAIAAAAAVPGTLVARVAGGPRTRVRFGHPSGVLEVGAESCLRDGRWAIGKVSLSRSARLLMSGWVHVPADALCVPG